MSSLDTLMARMVKSARCAASEGQWHSREMIRQSLAWGVMAATHRLCIPLPVLLDARSILDAGLPGAPFERNGARTPKLDEYDLLLEILRLVLQRHAGSAEELARQPAAGLSLLMAFWRPLAESMDKAGKAEAREWAEAYRRLAKSEQQIEKIFQNWNEPDRTGNPDDWAWWPGGEKADQVPPRALFWDACAPDASELESRGGAMLLHEQSSDGAIAYYLGADNVRPSLGQTRRIELLSNPHAAESPNPHPDAYSLYNLYFGSIPVSVLCMGELGESKIVNGSHFKLSSNPPANPDRAIGLHLVGFYTVASTLRMMGLAGVAPGGLASMEEPLEELRIGGDQALRGLAALLVDDWREIFRKLGIEFYLHWSLPIQAGISLGRGGWRWKTVAHKKKIAPPSPVAKFLFTRPSRVDLARAETRRPGAMDLAPSRPGQKAWYCGLALASDLKAFGFSPVEGSEHEQAELAFGFRPAWSATRKKCLLHRKIDSLIVLEDGGNAQDGGCRGAIYQARWGDDRVDLLRWHTDPDGPVDGSLLRMRARCLDLVLDVLENRRFRMENEVF